MKLQNFASICLICIAFVSGATSQAVVTPSPNVIAEQAPRVSAALSAQLGDAGRFADVSREDRERAYIKLLESQRYIWTITSSRRSPTQKGIGTNAALAREALLSAIRLNPKLDEAYTALAELYISIPPADVDEALALASLAVRIEPNSFGGHRIIARLNTYKSKLNSGALDKEYAAKAVSAWSEIARLDPRNAEAWAFLSEFYERAGKTDDQIASLRKWLSAAPPIEEQFYQRTMGARSTLSARSASLKLGTALLKAGNIGEAVEVLSLVAADDPENEEAIDFLRGAIESMHGGEAAAAARSLRTAAASNPNNVALAEILAQAQSRAGNLDEAVATLTGTAKRLNSTDRASASVLYVSLGDVYSRADQTEKAVRSYDMALSVRSIDSSLTISNDEREFAMQVFEKIIQTLKSGNRSADVPAAIERSRRLFGKDDLFADRSLISFYRETGKKQQALDSIRKVRVRLPADYGFVRLEATVLTELGRVDEGVAIIKRLIARKSAAPAGGPQTGVSVLEVQSGDEFSNYLFISNLYTQANRGKEASAAADQAYNSASGAERKQIARLTLATAQQMSGDFKAAEQTLRAILNESPGNPIALNNLGYFLLERDERVQEAFVLIEQAYRIDPTNPSFLDSLGWAYFRLGKLDDAERYLKDAARLNSGSSTIQEHLGDVYNKQGKADLAKTAWNKALQLASDVTDSTRLKAKLKDK